MRAPANRRRKNANIFYGLMPVFRKEVIHISRDLPTLIFVLFMTGVELLLVGFAVNTDVKQIKTVVHDLAGTQESRELINHFSHTDIFHLIGSVNSKEEMMRAIVSGEARVGIEIPPDFSRRLLDGRTATVLVVVDGSNAPLTTRAVNVSNQLMLQESIRRIVKERGAAARIDMRHTVLFNPSSRTADFVLPGMMVLSMQGIAVILVSVSSVREREQGTLEQLNLTPARPLGVLIGKMLPYGLFSLLQQIEILLVLNSVFGIGISGSYAVLLFFTVPFLFVALGLGLVISVKAQSLAEALQMAIGVYIPSYFLSGTLFELDSMPRIFQIVSKAVPATYYVEAVRGIVLRGAGLTDMWINAVVMTAIAAALIVFAAWQFRARYGK